MTNLKNLFNSNSLSLFFFFTLFFNTNRIPIDYFDIKIAYGHLYLLPFCITYLFFNFKNLHKKTLNSFLFLFIFLLLHSLVTIFFFHYDLFLVKHISSQLLLLVYFLVGFDISFKLTSNDFIKLAPISSGLTVLIVLSVIIEYFYPELFPHHKGYQIQSLYSGFFNEPSHLAITLFALFIILLTDKKMLFKSIGGLSFVICLFLSPSMTFIFLTFVFILASLLILKRLFIFLLLAIIMIIFFFIVDINYYLQRLNFHEFIFNPDGVSNVSFLIYMQTFYDVINSLKLTLGFGSGFNNMGIFDRASSPILGSFTNKNIYYINFYDGTNFGSKFVYEFGLFALIFYLNTVLIFFKKISLKKYLEKGADIFNFQILLFLILFIAISFTRSRPYFSHLYFLILSSIFFDRFYCFSIFTGLSSFGSKLKRLVRLS